MLDILLLLLHHATQHAGIRRLHVVAAQ
jgi:hypothetical protein